MTFPPDCHPYFPPPYVKPPRMPIWQKLGIACLAFCGWIGATILVMGSMWGVWPVVARRIWHAVTNS